MKKKIWLAASALPLIIAASAATTFAGTGAGEEGCPARERLVVLSNLFGESGACAKLPEGSRAAIRAFDEPTALANFRGIKKSWLGTLDRLSASLEKAFNESLQLPPDDPSVVRLAQVAGKTRALFDAVNHLRPDGGTTIEHLNQIEAALKAVPHEDFVPGAKGMLDYAARGISGVRQILFCRLADTERAQKVIQAQKECGGTGEPLPVLASAYQMFVGPIQILPSDHSVNDGAVNSNPAGKEALPGAICTSEEPVNSSSSSARLSSLASFRDSETA
jgi:hypothetical protein